RSDGDVCHRGSRSDRNGGALRVSPVPAQTHARSLDHARRWQRSAGRGRLGFLLRIPNGGLGRTEGLDMRTATVRMWILMGLLAGLGVLHAPGCGASADDAMNRDGSSTKGTCVVADDDGNPCTLEGCKGTPQEHVLVAGLPCGKDGVLKCDK